MKITNASNIKDIDREIDRLQGRINVLLDIRKEAKYDKRKKRAEAFLALLNEIKEDDALVVRHYDGTVYDLYDTRVDYQGNVEIALDDE